MHACASDHFQKIHDHFTLAHDIKQRGHRAEIHWECTGDQEVARDPCKFRHHHTDILRPDRSLYAKQLLYGQCKGQVVGWRAEIVEPIGQRKDLGIGEAFRQFLGTAVEIADMRIHPLDNLAVELKDEPEYPMGAGVLGTEVEKHFLAAERFAL